MYRMFDGIFTAFHIMYLLTCGTGVLILLYFVYMMCDHCIKLQKTMEENKWKKGYVKILGEMWNEYKITTTDTKDICRICPNFVPINKCECAEKRYIMLMTWDEFCAYMIKKR